MQPISCIVILYHDRSKDAAKSCRAIGLRTVQMNVSMCRFRRYSGVIELLPMPQLLRGIGVQEEQVVTEVKKWLSWCCGKANGMGSRDCGVHDL